MTNVTLNGKPLANWECSAIVFDPDFGNGSKRKPYLPKLPKSYGRENRNLDAPTFYLGHFNTPSNISEALDTFIDMSGWKKVQTA